MANLGRFNNLLTDYESANRFGGRKEKWRREVGLHPRLNFTRTQGDIGKKDKNQQEYLINWNKAINEIAEFKDKATDIKFDEEELAITKEKRLTAQNRQDEITEKLSSFQEKLKSVEQEATGILKLDEPICCRMRTIAKIAC